MKTNFPRHLKASKYSELGLFSDLATFRELETRIEALLSETDRGEAFEVFAEAYIATQKQTQAVDVYPFVTCPVDLLNRARIPIGADLGIDGLFVTTTSDLHAYQAKFRSSRSSLTWRELATFVGLSDGVSQRVLFTNSDIIPEHATVRQGFYCIRGRDLDRLTSSDLAVITSWLYGKPISKRNKNPAPHQLKAVHSALRTLETSPRATILMACGTGKTLVGLWVAENLNSKLTVVFVPSIALIRQVLHEWLAETAWPSVAYICICSDRTVSQNDDVLALRQSDLDFPVTTDKNSVRAFLDGESRIPRIVFCTYHSSDVLAGAISSGSMIELAIFDEAHRTAGRVGSDFASSLDEARLPIRKRLFMTATPRHYDFRKHDKSGDSSLVYSMDNVNIYGPVAYSLSFNVAASENIICPYKVIVSVVTSPMVREQLGPGVDVVTPESVIPASNLARFLALKRAVEKHNVKKIFTFHNSIKAAKYFAEKYPSGINGFLDGYKTYHVNGEQPAIVREKILSSFAAEKTAVITNARCLTEGVDLPAVDMVAFMSPRRSKVDIIQATGRAMRKHGQKAYGYILLPVFIQLDDNETIEEAVSKTNFDELWQVLQALQEQDTALTDIVRELRITKGRTGSIDHWSWADRIEFLGPEIEIGQIEKAITVACVDAIGNIWDEHFGELCAFKEKSGHLEVTRGGIYEKLAQWAVTQRQYKSLLSQYKIKKLNSIGFDWDPNLSKWKRLYNLLCQYKKKTGNCNVPVGGANRVPELSDWVMYQRTFSESLSAEQKSLLTAIGFEWYPQDKLWFSNYEDLRNFKNMNGHCNVPQQYKPNPTLGRWVNNQRAFAIRLNEKQKILLNDIGFDWDPKLSAWNCQFAKLRDYVTIHGDCNVPVNWREDKKLGYWVYRQKRYWHLLSTAQQDNLVSIGFIVPIVSKDTCLDRKWQDNYMALCNYKKETGQTFINRDLKQLSKLRRWTQIQRGSKSKLTEKQISLLDELGFIWDSDDNSWNIMFQKLKEFKEKNGTCSIGANYSTFPELASWCRIQRIRKSSLSEDKIARLDTLGFDWKPKDNAWNKMFQQLCNFQKEHGHCNVSRLTPGYNKVGSWTSVQRRLKSKLSAERIKLLTEIGFEW